MLTKISKENRPSLHRCILALETNGGVVSKYELLKVGGCPVKPGITKADSVYKIIEDLVQLRIIEKHDYEKTGEEFYVWSGRTQIADTMIEKHLQKMTLDALFIPDILKAVRGFNLVANKSPLYRSKKNVTHGVLQNNYMWDAATYTKAAGVTDAHPLEEKIEKRTGVVFDIVIHRHYLEYDLDEFLQRVRGVLNSVKGSKRRILPVVVYAKADAHVLNKLSKLGFLAFDMGSIYGSKIFKIIENLIRLKQAQLDMEASSENTEDLIEQTLKTMEQSGQEENLGNIKGHLFESLMFQVFQSRFPRAQLMQGRKFENEEEGKMKSYEYDIIVDENFERQEVLIVELKGYAGSKYISLGSESEKGTVRWFFDKTFPIVKADLRKRLGSHVKITASFITTAKIMDDGVLFLKNMNSGKMKPYNMNCWYDGTKLLEMLVKDKQTKVVDIIKKHYTAKP